MKSKVKSLLLWLDNNILFLLAGFLMMFIPLYPKWPLFDVLPGYNVRVRVEDFFVLFTALIFGIQFLRKKVQFTFNPVTLGLLGYLGIGLISTLAAIFVTGSVPMQTEFVGKTFLHWLRRVEYFSLFFIVFGAIKSLKSIKILTIIIFVTLIAVTLYGYGQKYLYWPAFSTMNREYAKGWWLYLTEHARVLSTFGGHYDLAGYLVITLSLCWSFYFGAKSWWAKILVGIVLAGGFWLLILTASRISFAAYLVGLSVVVLVWTFRKGFYWGVSRWFMAVFLSILIMLSFGDLSDRFLRLVRLDQRIGNLKQIVLKPIGNMPQNKAVFLENNLAAVTSKTDMPPLPRDVINNQPLMIEMKTASGASYFIERPREYSKNATLYDLSTAIRLDATWPRAIAGFKSNILTGQGYATLTQESKYEFTQGESTDSDFLRALGETGLLGFLAFFGTLVIIGLTGFKALGGVRDSFVFSLVAGFLGALVGLIGNASYIDIFTSSKVAEVFWGVAGLTMGSLYFLRDKIKADYQPLKLHFPIGEILDKIKKTLLSDRFWVLILAILAFAARCYKLDAPVADWHSWRQADTSAVTRNFIKNDRLDLLYPMFDDLSSVASGLPNLKGLRMVEFPIYNVVTVFVRIIIPEFNVESAGRATSALMSVASLVFLFLIVRKLVTRRAAYLTAAAFAFIPYNVFFSRTILPEPTMVAFSLGAIWFAIKEKYWLYVVFAALAMLAKPYAVFLIFPVLLFNFKKIVPMVIYSIFAVIPLLLWRLWIRQFPEAIPASEWLFNGDGIRFKGAFWFWLFADRIGRLILGYWGLIPFAFGLIKAPKFLWLFLLSTLSFLFVFATGNVRHDYYQIIIFPALAIFVGLGLDYLLSFKFRGILIAIVSSLFAISFGWYFIRDFYNINHPEIVEAGRALNDIATPKSLVVAPYQGDTAFLYQTNRAGWPIIEKPIDDMIKMGADFYVSVNPQGKLEQEMLANSETPEFIKMYPKLPRKKYILKKMTERYVIFQLRDTILLP